MLTVWCCLFGVLFVCRLILENLLKYGLRMNFFKYIAASLSGRGNLPLVLAFPALLLLSFASLGVELLAWRFVHGEDQVGGGEGYRAASRALCQHGCLGRCASAAGGSLGMLVAQLQRTHPCALSATAHYPFCCASVFGHPLQASSMLCVTSEVVCLPEVYFTGHGCRRGITWSRKTCHLRQWTGCCASAPG